MCRQPERRTCSTQGGQRSHLEGRHHLKRKLQQRGRGCFHVCLFACGISVCLSLFFYPPSAFVDCYSSEAHHRRTGEVNKKRTLSAKREPGAANVRWRQNLKFISFRCSLSLFMLCIVLFSHWNPVEDVCCCLGSLPCVLVCTERRLKERLKREMDDEEHKESKTCMHHASKHCVHTIVADPTVLILTPLVLFAHIHTHRLSGRVLVSVLFSRTLQAYRRTFYIK